MTRVVTLLAASVAVLLSGACASGSGQTPGIPAVRPCRPALLLKGTPSTVAAGAFQIQAGNRHLRPADHLPAGPALPAALAGALSDQRRPVRPRAVAPHQPIEPRKDDDNE